MVPHRTLTSLTTVEMYCPQALIGWLNDKLSVPLCYRPCRECQVERYLLMADCKAPSSVQARTIHSLHAV
jgi:hypothetical protein